MPAILTGLALFQAYLLSGIGRPVWGLITAHTIMEPLAKVQAANDKTATATDTAAKSAESAAKAAAIPNRWCRGSI